MAVQIQGIANQTLERDYSQKDRDKMDDSDFGDPENQAFPVKVAQDVINAASRLHNAKGDQSAIKSRIIRIAKRKGFPLPQTWQDEDDTTKTESSLLSPQSVQGSRSPRSRIASLQVCWIEDNARSLNGRLYPEETVSRLIASGQRKLSDPNALPITCFLSHDDADNDRTPALSGMVTRLWREGTRGMASIDIADTSHGRDALGQVAGRYLRSMSLRASGAELKTDKRYDVPVVGGDGITLDGIDFTNYPGLEACARIQQVQIAESARSTYSLTEVFDLPTLTIQEVFHQKEEPMSKTVEASPGASVTEAGAQIPASTVVTGNSQGMTNDPTQDAYGQRMYQAPPMTSGPMQGMDSPPIANAIDVKEAHDRIALVQNRECGPARESIEWRRVVATLSEADRKVVEAGKQLSAKNDMHLDAAHHAIARMGKMECEGVNNKRSTIDPDGDGDDDRTNDPVKNPDWAKDQMESTKKKGASPMATKEDALKLLESLGLDVQVAPKKTEAEILREQIATMEAKQAQQMEEMKALFAAATTTQKVTETVTEAPQRKSLVTGSNMDASAKGSIRGQLYQNGRYLKEQINKTDWEALTDRTCPLPEGLDLTQLIKEFEQLYAVQYDERFQVLSATELR